MKTSALLLFAFLEATINGNNIDIPFTFAGGCIDPFPSFSLDRTVGPLPAGTYTIRVRSMGAR